MLFNSLQFPVFFILFFVVYYLLPSRTRPYWILASGPYFYSAMALDYLWILLALIACDFVLGRCITNSTNPRRRLFLLLLGIVANFSVLLVFKWQYEFSRSFLPPGLSFHTFQSVAYLIEVYSGRFNAERSLYKYSQYILFWPQLVAGPIERPQGLLRQFRDGVSTSAQKCGSGLQLILLGAIKKIVVADTLATFTSPVFSDPARYGAPSISLALLVMSVEVYCDFSGYTDIARGCARMMGFELMENFRQPLLSPTPADLWRRWHISLTSWFRDYVYQGLIKQLGNGARPLLIILVFVLIGIWHGLRAPMILWGFYEAVVILVGQRALSRIGWWGIPLTFIATSFGCGLFKANSLPHAYQIYNQLLHWSEPQWNFPSTFQSCLAAVALSFALDFIARYQPKLWPSLHWTVRLAICTGGFIILILGGTFEQRSFIYYQF
jgi:alginate O-acetyltransferase complex protein AlgI